MRSGICDSASRLLHFNFPSPPPCKTHLISVRIVRDVVSDSEATRLCTRINLLHEDDDPTVIRVTSTALATRASWRGVGAFPLIDPIRGAGVGRHTHKHTLTGFPVFSRGISFRFGGYQFANPANPTTETHRDVRDDADHAVSACFFKRALGWNRMGEMLLPLVMQVTGGLSSIYGNIALNRQNISVKVNRIREPYSTIMRTRSLSLSFPQEIIISHCFRGSDEMHDESRDPIN